METRRLKNIAILILLLVNAFLLFLLAYQELQARRVEREAMSELVHLFATEELELSSRADLLLESLVPLSPVRSAETEAQIAAFFLGESVAEQSEGGGIVSYTSSVGTIQFRSNGGFDTMRFMRPVEDVDAFVQDFCSKFDYGDIVGSAENGSGSYTAVKEIDSVSVYGCTVTLTFRDGYLVGAVGAHVDANDAQADNSNYLSCMSALVRFFDHRRAQGVVCSAIESVQCVYRLQSSGGTPQLVPLWVVETDTYTYLVDGITGDVSRK